LKSQPYASKPGMTNVLFRSIEPSERDQVLDLLAEWYGDRDFFARYLEHDPTFSPDLCFVAEHEGRLVSTFQVFRKRVRVGATALDVAGVGNVFTSEAYRGRGIASELLRYGLGRLRDRDFDVSLLFAVRLAFYGQLGYRSHLRYLVFLAPGAAAQPSRRYTVRPFAPEDLPSVQGIYNVYSGRFPGTTLRDELYWRAQLRYAGNPNEQFLVATVDSQVVAYARATNLWDFYVVMEHGYLPGHDQALVELLVTHYHHGIQAYPGVISQLAVEPRILAALEAQGIKCTRIDDVFWMWRVVDPDRLAGKLGVSRDEVLAEDVWATLLPPESSVYWISDRF
jgi:predicted N-acetyltransferase YhbS